MLIASLAVRRIPLTLLFSYETAFLNDALISDLQAHFSILTDQLHQLLTRPASGKKLERLELTAPMVNLKGWLSHQPGFKRAYWRDRDHEYEVAGLGRCWSRVLSSREDIASVFMEAQQLLNELPNPASARCLSYLSFSDHPRQQWSAFGYGLVFLPVLEYAETRKGATLAINLRAETEGAWQESLHQALAITTLLSDQQFLVNSPFSLEPVDFSPSRQQWQSLLDQAFECFDQQWMKKVVLSREAALPLKGQISPWLLMQYWQMSMRGRSS